ncbi:MAG: FHA domain-containing protein [Microcella pacifica]|jgi:pSer/pThr/pTyr-binding forkhead associated (FHA) protein|uniref:FHA domain-containing protein n=1 Tax=Microcella pacifica TaxID=2591847 RepID=A0A9E5JQC1_9MICO|nr:FHA domain-containing protein [Microcella pacifica]NHF63041.1 FHA domain-containing protein [Microcella pacifica]
MAEAPQNGRTGDESTEYRPHETTVHYGPEFAAQLAAMEAGISPEELEVIAALPASSGLLIVRRGPNTGARFLLDSDVTVAGRHPDADIFLDDVTVSRKHASFLRHGSQFSVRDLGSLNGTFMAGERIEETVPLVDGSEVQVGKFHLTFYASRHDLPSSA